MQKKKNFFIALIMALLLSGFLFRMPIFYYLKSFSYQRAFMARLNDAVESEKDFDLREFRKGEWDEFVWVGPYENPCDLGDTFKKWWIFCRGAQDDSEFKVFYLKNSEPVAGFRVLRYYLEIVESPNIPKKIERDRLIFTFDHFEKYPTVQLHAPQ